jgi:penicillin-binding protein 1A
VTADGVTIYEHQVDTSHVLVAPYIAAEMTDLLQTTVNTGTGKAAQIGRPVAGKTGTTSSSKDGWFLGFSSGLTTGVWMGRDDARPVGGLHGGTAPARAFHDYMVKAVANRPVEQFDTQVTLPDQQLDNEEDFGGPDNGMMVDPDGNPIDQGAGQPAPGGGDQAVDPDGNPVPSQDQSSDEPPVPPQPRPQKLDQQWLDHVLGRDGNRQPRAAPRPQDGGSADRYPADSRPNQ